MRNIKLTIAYDGTNYKGWQAQKNGLAVQEVIEGALTKICQKRCRVYGASRTDAGVHARGQSANFKTLSTIPLAKIPKAFNSFLPRDVAIIRAEEVTPDFHAQFNAKAKHYRYYIFNSIQRDPFKEKYSWNMPYKLNTPLMKKEAKALLGKHDFKSFQAKDKRQRTSVREIFNITIKKRESFLIIDIEGDGFLYNMARNIVGTLVEIGRGYFPPGSMKRVLINKDRALAGPTAPAKGLFLMEVKY
ncbi:MAG: tRNA pseudouridine(38-40) synthase TruA [Candidatus Omnitrophota bacterium]